MASAAQIAANQANSKLSSGPVTPEGKAVVARNALKTGLTGRTVLLPTEDAEVYSKHLESFHGRYNPVGDAETELVQSIANTSWRIARIPSLEAGIFAVGRIKFADMYANEKDPQVRSTLIETEVYLAYEKQLRNLHVQESRLNRQLEKEIAKLTELQRERERKATIALAKTAAAYAEAERNGTLDIFNPAQFGFEFSIREIKQRLASLQPGIVTNPALAAN
jgi:hypothetical protein